MKILQFKRGTTDSDSKRTDLSAGELYINTNNNSVWVGKESGQFQIGSYSKVVTDVRATSQAADPTKAKLTIYYQNADGSSDSDDIEVNISGKVDSARTADKLSVSAGSSVQPVWFQDGKPVALKNSAGNNTQFIYWDTGKATASSTKIGDYNKPIYYNGASGFSPISSLSLTGMIKTTGALVCSTTGKVLATDVNGEIKSAGSRGGDSTPIWIEDGVFKECNDLSVSGIKSQILTTGGNRVQMATYNNCPFDFAVKTRFSGRVEIDNITVSSGQKLNNWNGSFLISGRTYSIKCKISSDSTMTFLLEYDESYRYSCSTSSGSKGLGGFLTLIRDKQNSEWLMNYAQTPILANVQWSDYPTNQVTVLSCKQIG